VFFSALAQAAEPVPLNIGELAKLSQPEEIPEERLRTIVGTGEKLKTSFSAVYSVGGIHHALAWTECDTKTCRGVVGILAGSPGSSDPASMKLVKRVVLPGPPKVFAIDGAQVTDVAVYDLDGDGQKELLVAYQELEPPRPALGSMAHDYISIYNLPQLSSAWQFEVHRSGGGAEPVCEWEVKYAASGRAGTAELNAEGGCQPPSLPDSPPKPPVPASKKRFVWQKATHRFVERAP
jgi:hypothetical protein